MLFEDTYLTVEAAAEGIYKDRGSKFIGMVFPVKTEAEVKEIVARLKKEHHGANHHCYAFRLGADKQAYRVNDDGEPSGTAGKPIYGQILSKDLTNVLIVVVRYFGGTLLGVSGLIEAYKGAAMAALANARIVEQKVMETYELTFSYEKMNAVMKIIKDRKLENRDQDFAEECRLKFSVRKNDAELLIDQFTKLGVGIKNIPH
jgi:uncharacterized YigZ family protein